jgi:hypothetical protein
MISNAQNEDTCEFPDKPKKCGDSEQMLYISEKVYSSTVNIFLNHRFL